MHLNRPIPWNVSPALVHPKWAQLWAKAGLAINHDGHPLVHNHGKLAEPVGSITGTVARGYRPYIGVGQETADGGRHGIAFTGPKGPFPRITIAVLAYFDVLSGTDVVIATDHNQTGAGGMRMQLSNGQFELGVITIAVISSGITLSTNTPYFLAISNDEKRNICNFVVRNLSTDAIQTAAVTNNSNGVIGTSGEWSFGYGRQTTESIGGVLSMGFIAADYFPMTFLVDWALDPWGPFRMWDEAKVVYATGDAPPAADIVCLINRYANHPGLIGGRLAR